MSDATADIDIARLYQEALAGALKLVGADGGELAMLDPVRRGMVVRARIRGGHPGASASGSAFGAPARSSQPMAYSSARYDPTRTPTPQPNAGAPEIGEQPTVLLPAAPLARVYHQDEGLIGAVWRRGDVTVMRGDEFRAAAHGTGAPGGEALWHVGTPIYRPGALDIIPPVGSDGDIIGVLTVYSDAARGFSGRDIEMLRMHADRVSRDLRKAELASQSQSQSELLEVLRSSAQDLPALYQRIRDLVRHLVDAPSFALVLYYQGDEVSLEVAERDGAPIPPTRLRAATLPAWWNAVGAGQLVRNASAEERAAHPEFSALGWGGDTPIASLLAAPLMTSSSFLGALVAASPHAEAYGPEQTQLFETIARAGAIVIENGRLASEMRHAAARNLQKAHQMAVLNNAALTINASLDLQTTVRALADQASHLTTAAHCSVFLLSEDRTQLVASASTRQREPEAMQQPATRAPLTWRDVGQILKSGQFTVMDHLEQDWQDDTSMGRLLKKHQIYSGLLVPIAHRAPTGAPGATGYAEDDAPQEQDELLGALFTYTPGQRHHFSPTEIGLLQGLASQAGAAISNARLYQNLKEANSRLLELDKLKNNFILTISHEFRTPLTTINGYISLITRHGSKLEPEKLSQFGGEIQMATDKLAGMIGMLADASMLEERALDVHIEPVSLRLMAQRAVAGLTEELKGRIALDIPADIWALADAERLPMVISNLLTNAAKYAPGGAPYRVVVRRERREQLQKKGHLLGNRIEDDGSAARNNQTIARAVSAHEHWLVTHVIDAGPGIAPDEQEPIFKRFVRAPQSLTTTVRGTGLGLWICREYIEAMGGGIWVESSLGRGSDFQFCLPETAAPVAAQPPAQSPA